MFRKLFLCAIMCLLLAGAISAGANLPVLLGMGALTVLAFYAPTAHSGHQG
ncbi:MAG: hypothetical protein HW378_2902 [Anaerolineales bacterium]|jgi:hypothetical protein|nr:hypothetical protein [Anaerolineales bacterium]MBM2848374.1 hypothetical protein [Anaerolineales bacterium]